MDNKNGVALVRQPHFYFFVGDQTGDPCSKMIDKYNINWYIMDYKSIEGTWMTWL